VSQWGDFSNLNATSVPIKYGIQIKTSLDSKWAHCATPSGPLLFDSAQSASDKIMELKKRFLARPAAKLIGQKRLKS